MDIASYGIYACLFLALYFEIFLLITFLEKRPEEKTSTLPKRYPSVSILVPCWNEEKTLASTIESLLALEYPKDKFEIVVIDDGSTDGTRTIAESFTKNPQVKFFHKKNGGKYTALNFGIAHTTSDIVGCLDADSFVASDALIEMIKCFEQDQTAMAVAPAMKVYRPHTMLELMQSVEYTFGIFYKKMFDNLAAINVLPGPFSMYRRETFGIIGPYRQAHNSEDLEMTFRMHKHGLKILQAHTAFVYTTVPRTVRALVKQRTRWSQGFLQNSQDYSYMYLNPNFGNFGMFILPFSLASFAAGLYSAGYALFHILSSVVSFLFDTWKTHIPLHIPTTRRLDWFFIDTSTLSFIIIVVLLLSLVAIIIGQKIAETQLSPKSFLSYFMLYGFIAPLWLANAAWGAIRSKESTWR